MDAKEREVGLRPGQTPGQTQGKGDTEMVGVARLRPGCQVGAEREKREVGQLG